MKKYDFMFSEDEANLILSALGELPAKTTMGLIVNIQKQYKEQTEVKEVVEEDVNSK